MEEPTVLAPEPIVSKKMRLPSERKRKSRARAKGKRHKAPAGLTNEIRAFIDKHPDDTYKMLREKIAKKWPHIKPKRAEWMIWAERTRWFRKRWKHGKGPKRKKAKKGKAKKRTKKRKAAKRVEPPVEPPVLG